MSNFLQDRRGDGHFRGRGKQNPEVSSPVDANAAHCGD
jgi:hypothetical protein